MNEVKIADDAVNLGILASSKINNISPVGVLDITVKVYHGCAGLCFCDECKVRSDSGAMCFNCTGSRKLITLSL